MISIRVENEEYRPKYMTSQSSCCDLMARGDHVINPNSVAAIPTGVWINSYTPSSNNNVVEELQIRSRSSFPLKRSLMIANGIGTIDADYRDEICVLFYNFGASKAEIKDKERIAQMTLSTNHLVANASITETQRTGGFGSTENISKPPRL